MTGSLAAFRSIVFSAALAGLLVGAFVTVVQQFGTVPLIMRAEVYERQALTAPHGHDEAAHTTHPGTHDHGTPTWEPADGTERNAYTALFNVVEWIGFGLVLNGGFVVLGRSADWREGLFWGLGAFLAFVIAPGLGLPPELPGIPAAPLLARQLWWVGTVAATGSGLLLIALRRAPLAAFAGIALIVAPHVIGAPRLDHVETDIPTELLQQFIVAVTLTALPCWALLGGLTGHFYRRFSAA